MRITVHLPSVLGGALALVLVFLIVGAVQSSSAGVKLDATVPGTQDGMVRIAGVPAWGQMVRIVEGTPYQVPPGKVLVMTGAVPTNPQVWELGTCNPSTTPFNMGNVSATYKIFVNGVETLTGAFNVTNTSAVFFWGYVVPTGCVVEIDDDRDCPDPNHAATIDSMILGYLANAW
jgi:hypothetical protein